MDIFVVSLLLAPEDARTSSLHNFSHSVCIWLEPCIAALPAGLQEGCSKAVPGLYCTLVAYNVLQQLTSSTICHLDFWQKHVTLLFVLQGQGAAMPCSSTHGRSSPQWGHPWWSPSGSSGTLMSLWLPWPMQTAWCSSERAPPSKPLLPCPYRSATRPRKYHCSLVQTGTTKHHCTHLSFISA